MTRWVRWIMNAHWHAVEDENPDLPFLDALCGRRDLKTFIDARSDHEPIEDECPRCRRALDGGKQ